jgi:NADP-dependent aldehyde dehydrogenase
MLHRSIAEHYGQGLAAQCTVPGVRQVAGHEPVTAGPGQGRASVQVVDAVTFCNQPSLQEELFGPSTLVVLCSSATELIAAAATLSGQLTASIHGSPADLREFAALLPVLERRVGRLVFDGFPTGVEVCHAMHHGGPFPATTDARMTSVGSAAIQRFLRPVCYQNAPQHLLPVELRDGNPAQLLRLVDGVWTRE